MSSMLRLIVPQRVSCLASTLNKLSLASSVNVESVRTMFLPVGVRLQPFIRAQQMVSKDPLKSIEKTKAKLNEATQLEGTDLFNSLSALSLQATSDEDFNMVATYLKKNNLQDARSKNIILSNLYKRSIQLNKKDKMAELFKSDPLFRSNAGFAVTATSYFENDKLDEIIKLFEEFFPFYSENTREQKVPFNHTQIVMTSLLKQNTKQSLEKAKELVKKIQSINSKLPVTSVVQICVLAILQNDAQYAKEFMTANELNKINMHLEKNFQILIDVNTNDLKQAVENFRFLMNGQPSLENMTSVKGRVFPLVLSKLTQAMETCNDEELKKKFNVEKVRAESLKKIMFMDLVDFAMKNSLHLVYHNSNLRLNRLNNNNNNNANAENNNNNRPRRQNNYNRPQQFGDRQGFNNRSQSPENQMNRSFGDNENRGERNNNFFQNNRQQQRPMTQRNDNRNFNNNRNLNSNNNNNNRNRNNNNNNQEARKLEDEL